jgi:hypothetical protein
MSQLSRGQILLLSFGIATLIWLLNGLNKDGYELKVEYPIKITYDESLYIPTSPLPDKLNLTLSGRGWILLRKSFAFTVKPVVYHLANPLSSEQINQGVFTAQMSEQIVGVQVKNIENQFSLLRFDKRVIKTVRLRADSSDIAMDSHFVISSFINLNPNMVTFNGPAALIGQIKDSILIRIPAKQIRANYDEELPIGYPHSPLVKASSEKVFVSFEVAEIFKNN